MFFACFAVDEDIVEIDKNIFVEDLSENVIHEYLEGCRCIHKAKGYDEEFVVAISVLNAVSRDRSSRRILLLELSLTSR